MGLNRKTSDIRVRFRDLSVTDATLKGELLAAVDRVLTHGMLLLGPEVELLEHRIAEYCGKDYCVGVSSGTDALYLALRSAGLGPGDQVITTPLSWIATANAIFACGSEPVYVDIGEDLNIDADLIEEAITSRTKAIVPVHFTGRLCNMSKILSVAKKHSLLVIEDAAQAFGAHMNGEVAGSFGDINGFSMNPMKVFSGYGEAGAVVTNSKESYDKLMALRYLGTVDKEICYYPSLNAKIDTIQAAMLLISLAYVERNIESRISIARAYSDALFGTVICPPLAENSQNRHVFFDYTIVAEDRDDLRECLAVRGIETKIKHPILMPDQPAYAHLPRVELPVARRIVNQILSLPIHEKLSMQQVHYVAEGIKEFYSKVAE